MEITEQKSAGVVTLRLSGRLDTTTAPAFEDKILGRIESGERHVVIDLAQLDYISSAGLRVIVLAGKRLSAANGKTGVVLAQGSGQRSVRYRGVFVHFLHLRLPRRRHEGSAGMSHERPAAG